MPKAAIFDVDGTLLDSVDLHALAWHEAMMEFGHDVSFEQARSQIGKGGDKLIPRLPVGGRAAGPRQGDGGMARRALQERVSAADASVLRGPRSAETRARRRPASPSRPPPKRTSSRSTSISPVSRSLSTSTTSSDDVEESKPAPDIFEVVLKKLQSRRRRRRDRRLALRCGGGRQSGHLDDRRALRRVHRRCAAGSRWRRCLSRAGRAFRALRRHAVCEVAGNRRRVRLLADTGLADSYPQAMTAITRSTSEKLSVAVTCCRRQRARPIFPRRA